MSCDISREDAITALITNAYLAVESCPDENLEGASRRNARPVQALCLLLEAGIAVATGIEENILEDLKELPPSVQRQILSRLQKIARNAHISVPPTPEP